MNPESLTPKQIATLLDTLETMNKIGDAVKAHAIKLVHAGTVIPGWEAAQTAARRMWTDEDKASEVLGTLGLDKREKYSIELLSPAQAEKLLRTKKLWPKGAAKEDFVSPFQLVLGYTDTKPTIRKSSDT